MSGGLQVVPAELHVSASLVDGHAGAVQAGHGAADSELAAAQAALAGSGGPTPPVRTPSLPCRACTTTRSPNDDHGCDDNRWRSEVTAMDSRQEKIRQDVLLDALVDLVNLAGVDARVKQHYQSASDREVQSETLQTIRTLVNDGLIRVGYRGPDGQLVPEPLEKAMQEIHDAYIPTTTNRANGWGPHR